MALAQIAVPLTDDRAGLTTAVVVLFAATTTALVAGAWGWRRAMLAAVVVVVGTTVLERVGSTTGWPFGDYRYTDALSPTIVGVPLAVVLAWWAMAVPARAVAVSLAASNWARVVLGALALTAWDVMLDPQMVDERYWVWDGGGPWREVPLSNYAGWLGASLVVMVVLDRLLPLNGRAGGRVGGAGDLGPGDLGLLGLYSWWAVMSTLGFLAFFGDPLVGLVGGLVMLPLPVLAWRRVLAARG